MRKHATSDTPPVVTQPYWLTLQQLLNPKGKNQDLPGFDDEFVDIVDYILRITHRIWEQKQLHLCRRYYTDICPVHTLGGYSETQDQVVQATLVTLAAFPDRTLIGENVVWRALENDGFYTSHRITSVMTNTGNSEFGPSTGRTGRVTTIADCVCRNNKIEYEWLMRDNSFLCACLGIELLDAAKEVANADPGEAFWQWYYSEHKRVRKLTLSDVSAKNTEQAFVHNWLNSLFNQLQFNQIPNFYSINARVQWPGGREITGYASLSGLFIEFLAQFPDAKVSCDHLAVSAFDKDTTDIAIRWTLAGHFQSKTPELSQCKNQPLLLLAATHLRIRANKIVQEWTVFDEVAMYANLFRQLKTTDGNESAHAN